MRNGMRGAAAVGLMVAGAAAAEPSLERGAYLVEGPAACGNCHTPLGPEGPVMEQHLGGRLVEQSDAFTAIAGNITPGGGWRAGRMPSSSGRSVRGYGPTGR